MIQLRFLITTVGFAFIFTSCGVRKPSKRNEVNRLRFIGEKVISVNQFKGTEFGGLSSIDYYDGKWYAISDDAKNPVRFYTLRLRYDENNFTEAVVEDVTFITNGKGMNFAPASTDPEALRFDAINGTFIWASEGQINKGINPSVREITQQGSQIRKLPLPELFTISKITKTGPRHNGTLEGLSLTADGNGYWLSMELPLQQDGNLPELEGTLAPTRITHLEKNSGKIHYQFVYMLDNVARQARPASGFKVNGVVEILAVSDKKLLVLERSFASGWQNGGNDVKIYKIDVSEATDVKNLQQLKKATYTPVKKQLIFDFESIRAKLTNSILDNIEGMAFGPDLPNGNKSLVVIADNNFNEFSKQLNQIIVFEVLP
jgi:hypothetical protein